MKVVNLYYNRYDVYIGRPSEWGNPYIIGVHGNRKEVIQKYYEYLKNNEYLMNKINELDGKILGCYCKPKECHGDVIIQILNEIKMNNFMKEK